ncbi:MAG: DUF6286 domain-containing protein [Pseudonocardia sp.]|jgi:hypothetical protein
MRVLLRVLAPLLGLGLAAAGALLMIEVTAAWLLGDQGVLVPWPAWQSALDSLTWRSLLVIAVCAAVALLGLLLVVLAGTARRRDIRLQDPAEDVSVTTSPRVLARLVGQRVRAEEQVASASVTASARAVKVVAVCRGEVPEGLSAGVGAGAGALLDDLPLARRPRLAVSVRSDGGPR